MNVNEMGKVYSEEELKNSNRIQKSATPKYTLDWYVKWVASIMILIGMSIRGVDGLQVYDLSISIITIFAFDPNDFQL